MGHCRLGAATERVLTQCIQVCLVSSRQRYTAVKPRGHPMPTGRCGAFLRDIILMSLPSGVLMICNIVSSQPSDWWEAHAAPPHQLAAHSCTTGSTLLRPHYFLSSAHIWSPSCPDSLNISKPSCRVPTEPVQPCLMPFDIVPNRTVPSLTGCLPCHLSPNWNIGSGRDADGTPSSGRCQSSCMPSV